MRKTAVLLLAILLTLLPFHPFLSTFLASIIPEERDFLVTLIKSWKEILVAFFCILALFFWWMDKKAKQFDCLDLAIFLFAILSFIVGFFFTGKGFPENMPQIVWGAKYGLLFLFLLFFVRRIPFYTAEKNDLICAALLSATTVICFSLLQATLLPEEFLTRFGYNEQYGNTEISGGISYCHKIENSITHEEFCRIQSTLSGPNELGAYLLVVLPFFFYRAIRARSMFRSLFFLLPFFGGVVALLLSWSRSAWIGALSMAAAFFVVEARKPFAALLYLLLFGIGIVSILSPAIIPDQWDEFKFFSLACGGLALLFLLVVLVANLYHHLFSQAGAFLFPSVLGVFLYVRGFYDTFFWNIIYRPSSSQGHWQRWADGAQYIFENPFGLGLGDAGPASARFANPGETGFLPESWYLQVGLESGFLGLALFLTILILLAKLLLQSDNEYAKPVFLGLVGVSSAALFLHSWESSVVALTFWTLAGVVISKEKEENSLLKSVIKKLRSIFTS